MYHKGPLSTILDYFLVRHVPYQVTIRGLDRESG
jgi:hypothetical protein